MAVKESIADFRLILLQVDNANLKPGIGILGQASFGVVVYPEGHCHTPAALSSPGVRLTIRMQMGHATAKQAARQMPRQIASNNSPITLWVSVFIWFLS
jgi:hypothetical protein